MINKTKKVLIGVFSLIILSSFSTLASLIIHNLNNTKNLTAVRTIKNYKKESPINKHYNIALSSLIRNLTYVEEYIQESVISKQDALKYSILGCNTKGIKHYKISELGWLNKHSTIKKNRYSHQVNATITNSNNNLDNENKKIKDIIAILKNHPYTYQQYLNINKYIIPNISFFIKKPSSTNLDNLKLKPRGIYSNSYYINHTNTNIANISDQTEEDVVGAKQVSIMGSSITKAVFNQISFTGKIISFNPYANSYQFAVITSKFNTIKKKNINLANENILKAKNSKISKSILIKINHLSFLTSNRLKLTKLLSLSNVLVNNNNTYYPQYFNKYSDLLGKSNIKYNEINKFKNNKSLYSVVIVLATIFDIIPFSLYCFVGIPVAINDIYTNKVKFTTEEANGNDEELDNNPVIDVPQTNTVENATEERLPWSESIEDQALYILKVEMNTIALDIHDLGFIVHPEKAPKNKKRQEYDPEQYTKEEIAEKQEADIYHINWLQTSWDEKKTKRIKYIEADIEDYISDIDRILPIINDKYIEEAKLLLNAFLRTKISEIEKADAAFIIPNGNQPLETSDEGANENIDILKMPFHSIDFPSNHKSVEESQTENITRNLLSSDIHINDGAKVTEIPRIPTSCEMFCGRFTQALTRLKGGESNPKIIESMKTLGLIL